MELAGYLLLVIVLATRGRSDPFIPLFAVALLAYAMLLTLWAVVLEAASARPFHSWQDVARLSVFAAAEQVGFRQLLLWCRLRAAWGMVRGEHSGDREPLGIAAEEDDAPAAAERAQAS